jgi:hypothetical protein
MDGHGRYAEARDDGVTARAASCHSCPWGMPLSVCAIWRAWVQAPSQFPMQVLMRPIDPSCLLLPGLAWPRRRGSGVLPGAVRATPWLGCSASVPLVSPQGMLPGGSRRQPLAQFVMFFVSCLFSQTRLCLGAFSLHWVSYVTR